VRLLLEIDRFHVLAFEHQVGHLPQQLVDLVAHAQLAQAAEALRRQRVQRLQRLRSFLRLQHALEARHQRMNVLHSPEVPGHEQRLLQEGGLVHQLGHLLGLGQAVVAGSV